ASRAALRPLDSFPTRSSSDLISGRDVEKARNIEPTQRPPSAERAAITSPSRARRTPARTTAAALRKNSPSIASIVMTSCSQEPRSEEHTSELQSREKLVCRLL